jgi:4a-hydroxytetrahydrobiopterin dehydratase
MTGMNPPFCRKTAFNDLQTQARTNWRMEEDSLYAQWVFKDFAQAMAFMNAVADVAERMKHHPEWTNVYNRVNVRLTTHDAGGLTHLDFDLARAMDTLAMTASQS